LLEQVVSLKSNRLFKGHGKTHSELNLVEFNFSLTFTLGRELINGLGPTSALVSASGFEAAFVRDQRHVA
jgi:hypothetical protein